MFGAAAPVGRDRRARRVGCYPRILTRNCTRSRSGALGDRALPSDKITQLQFCLNCYRVRISRAIGLTLSLAGEFCFPATWMPKPDFAKNLGQIRFYCVIPGPVGHYLIKGKFSAEYVLAEKYGRLCSSPHHRESSARF